jgi:predicted GNAT family acetyltransferase
MADVAVRHEPDAHRFAADVAGGTAELAYMYPNPNLIVFVHTEVPEEAEGGGVGSALAKAGLDWARGEGARVLPLCPFVAAYVHRHPEYRDLLDGRGEGGAGSGASGSR